MNYYGERCVEYLFGINGIKTLQIYIYCSRRHWSILKIRYDLDFSGYSEWINGNTEFNWVDWIAESLFMKLKCILQY